MKHLALAMALTGTCALAAPLTPVWAYDENPDHHIGQVHAGTPAVSTLSRICPFGSSSTPWLA